MLDQAMQQQLIDAAIYAPSADNSQPFQVRWNLDQSLSLFIDPTRSGKASDNRFVLADIALGCVIENVIITAHSNQLATHVTFFPDEQSEYHVCDITFTPSEEDAPEDTLLAQHIKNRATDRRFPFKGELDANTISALENSGSNYHCHVQWFNDKTSKRQALPVIQQAESIRFKSPTLHQELFSTVHFGNPKSDEGMPIEVLAIEKPAQPMFKLMKKWSVMNAFNKVGAYKMLGLRSVKLPIMLSPSLALITISDNSRQAVINGGRALQRFWLQATAQGLSVQPYAAPGIFSLGFVKCEPEFNNQLNEVAKKMTSIVDGEGYGLMFLRLGFQKPLVHRSNRRAADSFKFDNNP
ncbi:hypothetical protein [Colwellia sp. MEBiC06753]